MGLLQYKEPGWRVLSRIGGLEVVLYTSLMSEELKPFRKGLSTSRARQPHPHVAIKYAQALIEYWRILSWAHFIECAGRSLAITQ